MKKLVFLFFLLSVSFTNSQNLVKPDTLWTYGPAHFTSYPAVHPNGNVLVRIEFDVHELNGLTGELIRKINIPVGTSEIGRIDVSQDGTKLLAGGYFIDYNSGELIRTLPNNYRYCFIHPFNDVIMYIQQWGTEPISDFTFRRYNLSTSEEIPIRTDFPVTSLEVSNDGKYLAIGCLELEPEERTHFYLYDAQTMKPIRELENVPSTGRRIEFIQFSETAKYVGYGHLGGENKATLFSCLAPYLKYEYQYDCIGFIDDKYIFLSNFDFLKSSSIIYDFQSEREIYQTNIYSSTLPQVNNIFNSLILNYYYSEEHEQIINLITSLDLDAISGVDVSENPNPEVNLSISYLNGYLQISKIKPTTIPTNIKLFDLNGKMIYQSMQPIIEGSLQIRIDLLSGVYILQMQAGDKQYSQKFIISN